MKRARVEDGRGSCCAKFSRRALCNADLESRLLDNEKAFIIKERS